MQNIIEQVYYFNQEAGLLGKGYSDTLESAFQIEEALEGFSFIHSLGVDLGGECAANDSFSAKDISRLIVERVQGYLESIDGNTTVLEYLSDVDRLDKACDAIVFAIGSMAKLGLTPSQIEQALNVVTTANLQKLGMPKDDYGKIIKPTDFVGPEILLQAILDER